MIHGIETAIHGTETAIHGIEPMIDSIEPLADSAEPLIDSIEPPIDGVKPLVDGVKPLVDGAEPLVDGAEASTVLLLGRSDIGDELVQSVSVVLQSGQAKLGLRIAGHVVTVGRAIVTRQTQPEPVDSVGEYSA
jgi:hypothetical protein